MDAASELKQRLREWLKASGVPESFSASERLYPIVVDWLRGAKESRDVNLVRSLNQLALEIQRRRSSGIHYNPESLCVHCTHLRPALDPNIQKAYLGKCVKREFPFTLAITLQGWTECEVFEDAGKAYVPPDPTVATAAAAAAGKKGPKRIEFYYSSKQKSGELFPCDNNKALELINTLKAAGVDAKAIDVSTIKDRFPIYHKSVSGPDATVRPVFGAKGALVDDFGTNVPALLVFEGDRYPTEAFPRSDAKRGTIRVEQVLEDLVREVSAKQKQAVSTA